MKDTSNENINHTMKMSTSHEGFGLQRSTDVLIKDESILSEGNQEIEHYHHGKYQVSHIKRDIFQKVYDD